MKSRRLGYTLMEMSAVVFTIGALSLAVVPWWQKSMARKREADVKAQILQLRQGTQAFRQDAGCWPSTLTDLTKVSAPAACISDAGASIAPPGDFRGPYVQYVPSSSLGTGDHAISILYSTASGTGHGVGSLYVSSTVGSTDSDGRAFSNY